MRQIRRACTAVLVSIAMIGTSGCAPRRPRAFQQRSDEGARGWLARSNRRRSAGQRRARNRPTSLSRKGQGHDLRPDARALSWSAPVRRIASVAVGAAAILSTSVAGAARDALAWVLPRDGEASSGRVALVRASQLLVATVLAALRGTPAKVSDG